MGYIAERNQYAKFVGVWEVISKRKRKTKGFRYRTKELPGFKEIEARLIAKWGEGTRSWAQWLKSTRKQRYYRTASAPNYVMDFPGYYNFTLSYDQLSVMVNNPDSTREWQRMLSSVSGGC